MTETIEKYIYPAILDYNHRFKSWEHCYKAFSANHNADALALNLAFYLASWGMYRGSSGLLWKDYKIHIPAVEIIRKFSELKTTQWEKPEIAKILEFKEILFNYYYSIEYNNGKGQGVKNITATDTLISKIILGTTGCLPAFDRYFNIGFKGTSTISINKSTLDDLYKKIDLMLNDIMKSQKLIRQKLNYNYPVMKIIDMYYWQRGFETRK